MRKRSTKSPVPPEKFECPASLRQTARAEWDKIIADLLPRGILRPTDAGPLALYCNAFALWQEAAAAVQQYGSVIKADSGFPVQSPYVSIMNQQADTMMRIATEFGFTPRSRERITEPRPEIDDFALITLKPLAI